MTQFVGNRESSPLARALLGDQNGAAGFAIVSDQRGLETLGVELTDACNVELLA
jgi:hypothetical protein